jgi:hypothetical protein
LDEGGAGRVGRLPAEDLTPTANFQNQEFPMSAAHFGERLLL